MSINRIRAYAYDIADGFNIDDIADPYIALHMLKAISNKNPDSNLSPALQDRVQIFLTITADSGCLIEDQCEQVQFKQFLSERIVEKINQLSKFLAEHTELANDFLDSIRIDNPEEAPVLAEALKSVIRVQGNYDFPKKFEKKLENLVYLFNTPEDYTKTPLEQERMVSIIKTRIEKRIAELSLQGPREGIRNSFFSTQNNRPPFSFKRFFENLFS